MSLALIEVTKHEGDDVHIHPTSLQFAAGSMNVLLGATRSGKTSLMRLMAGLDTPTSGRIEFNGQDVTGVPVQKRNLSMVYQQFINYPSMTVYENIAAPLRLQAMQEAAIDQQVRHMAELLKIEAHLDRKPLELSGGQQQRCALARALVKQADLVLLDEPLANLDYKLREELRMEIPKLFADSGAIFVYATTEPNEALLLGGNTATLYHGQVQQFGPAAEVFRQPHNLLSAQVFSDPPMNVLTVTKQGRHFIDQQGGKMALSAPLQQLADGRYLAGFRANHLLLEDPPEPAMQFDCTVTVTEMTGSESYIHLDPGAALAADHNWIALVHGIHDHPPGTRLTAHVKLTSLQLFGDDLQAVAINQELDRG